MDLKQEHKQYEQLNRQAHLIAKSGLPHAQWYAQQYRDVFNLLINRGKSSEGL